MSEKEKVPRCSEVDESKSDSSREAWRVFGIMSEFVEATERLSAIRPAVSIFGSAAVGGLHDPRPAARNHRETGIREPVSYTI